MEEKSRKQREEGREGYIEENVRQQRAKSNNTLNRFCGEENGAGAEGEVTKEGEGKGTSKIQAVCSTKITASLAARKAANLRAE